MRLPKFTHVVLTGAALGTLAPLLFFTWHRFQEYVAGGSGLFLWPSVMFLMAIGSHEYEAESYVTIAISTLANVFLYAAIAALFWVVVRIVQRVATRTP